MKSEISAFARKTTGQRESGTRWTFMTNHSHVLLLIHGQTDMTVRELASRVGITERAVQRIIQDLEDGGFILRERVGRRNQYVVLMDQPLRHSIEGHRKVGELLTLLAPDDDELEPGED